VALARINRDGGWWVAGAAQQDALGDCIGTALRYGHYIATPKKEVVMIDNIELFHLEETDVRIFEPIYEFLPKKAYPTTARSGCGCRRRCGRSTRRRMPNRERRSGRRGPEIERYLIEMRRNIHAYAGEVFEMVMTRVKAEVFPESRGGTREERAFDEVEPRGQRSHHGDHLRHEPDRREATPSRSSAKSARSAPRTST